MWRPWEGKRNPSTIGGLPGRTVYRCQLALNHSCSYAKLFLGLGWSILQSDVLFTGFKLCYCSNNGRKERWSFSKGGVEDGKACQSSQSKVALYFCNMCILNGQWLVFFNRFFRRFFLVDICSEEPDGLCQHTWSRGEAKKHLKWNLWEKSFGYKSRIVRYPV